jgi:hypothetical protein
MAEISSCNLVGRPVFLLDNFVDSQTGQYVLLF